MPRRAPHTALPSNVRAGEAMAQEHSWQLLMEDNFQSAAVLQELIEVCEPPAEILRGRAAGPQSQGAAGLAALLWPCRDLGMGRECSFPPCIHVTGPDCLTV